ncbi:MAG TPA: PilN domain-containing protein, partial [Dehalococcoidia bacterium]|nr:PilN domain-containing protein [Dehalococcoidia bacterium]
TLLARLSTITDTAVPAGVSLSGVAPLGGDFSVVGTASSHAETLSYAANLKESPLFADARVIRVDGSGGADPSSETSVSFQIRVSVPQTEEPDEGSSK